MTNSTLNKTTIALLFVPFACTLEKGNNKLLTDFQDNISWEKTFTNETNGWRSFSAKKIKRAVEYVPSQGNYGSCVVNSVARSVALMGLVLFDYQDYLQEAQYHASNYLKIRNQYNSWEKKNFDSIIDIQKKKLKKDEEYIQNTLSEYFDEGMSFINITKFCDKKFKLFYTKVKYYNNIESAINDIIKSLEAMLPVIASFKAGENSEGKQMNHAMNIVGYKKVNGSIRFSILNTWGGNKLYGIMEHKDMLKCLNTHVLYFFKS